MLLLYYTLTNIQTGPCLVSGDCRSFPTICQFKRQHERELVQRVSLWNNVQNRGKKTLCEDDLRQL